MKKHLILIPFAALSLNAAEVRTAGGIVYTGAVEYKPATVVVTSASGQKRTFTLEELDAASVAKLLPKGNPYETINELEKKLKAAADVYTQLKNNLDLAIKIIMGYQNEHYATRPLLEILSNIIETKTYNEKTIDEYFEFLGDRSKAMNQTTAALGEAKGKFIIPSPTVARKKPSALAPPQNASQQKTETIDGIPADVYNRIRVKAVKDWPDDFFMQKSMIDLEVKSYKEINK